jgi:hypothetical protein
VLCGRVYVLEEDVDKLPPSAQVTSAKTTLSDVALEPVQVKPVEEVKVRDGSSQTTTVKKVKFGTAEVEKPSEALQEDEVQLTMSLTMESLVNTIQDLTKRLDTNQSFHTIKEIADAIASCATAIKACQSVHS